jgi:hypothetical protein
MFDMGDRWLNTSWLPAGFLEAARAVDAASTARLAAAGVKVESKPSVWVDRQMDACDMCDVGGVFGPGNSSCKVSATCPADPAANTSANFTEHHIMMGSVTVTPLAAGKAPATSEVRQALMTLVSGGKQTHTGVHVSVWDGSLPESLKMYEPDPPAGSGEGARTYYVGFVATSKGDKEAVTQGFAASQPEGRRRPPGPAAYSRALAAALNASAVDASCCTSYYVPAYSSPELRQAAPMLAVPGSMAVFVAEAGSVGVPVGSVAKGGRYIVQLSGFPVNAQLSLTLVGPAGKIGAKPATSALGNPKADAQGAASFVWEVPRLQPEGQYYIMAGCGVCVSFGTSGVLQVRKTTRTRKLGRLLEIPL